MRSTDGSVDFSQYYSGALVARYGLWDSLYPIGDTNVFEKEPLFVPLIESPFYQASESKRGIWNFYPQISSPESSAVAPQLLELCEELQEGYRYAYPPPLALLLKPLALVNYIHASIIWFTLMCFSYFGIAFYASRIFRALQGHITYTEGLVAVLPIIPTLLSSTMSTSFAIGNVSPFLGFLITWVTYSWYRNRQISIGLGMIPLLLFKGIGVSWCLLLVIRPIRITTLVTLFSVTLVLNIIVIHLAGLTPYQIFFTDILPKANLSRGVGLQGLFMTFLGVDTKSWVMLLNVVLLSILYVGYWRGMQSSNIKSKGIIIIATLAGTMATFCICNSIVWPHHYFCNYLQLPFAGWILWEANQARGILKNLIRIMFILSMLFWLDGVFLTKQSYFMEWVQATDNYPQFWNKARSVLNGVVVNVFPITASLFMLLLAYRRIYLMPKEPA